MSDKPIIFSADSVRAILEGRKTVTRRVVKPQPPDIEIYQDQTEAFHWERGIPHAMYGGILKCPYQVVQRLWVRERAAFYWGAWHYFADGPCG